MNQNVLKEAAMEVMCGLAPATKVAKKFGVDYTKLRNYIEMMTGRKVSDLKRTYQSLGMELADSSDDESESEQEDEDEDDDYQVDETYPIVDPDVHQRLCSVESTLTNLCEIVSQKTSLQLDNAHEHQKTRRQLEELGACIVSGISQPILGLKSEMHEQGVYFHRLHASIRSVEDSLEYTPPYSVFKPRHL